MLRSNKSLYIQNFAAILRNPFYIGLIRLKATGETFQGAHSPLIPKHLFDRVQEALDGRMKHRVIRHDLLFRKLIRCKMCGYSLIGEVKRNAAYYRCHTQDCPVKGIRQDVINTALTNRLQMLELSEKEQVCLPAVLRRWQQSEVEGRHAAITALELRIGQITVRLERLTDALIEGLLDKPAYEERKTALLMERREAEEQLAMAKTGQAATEVEKILEFAKSAYSLYVSQSPEEKRELVQIVTSNGVFDGKTLDFPWKFPYGEIANRWQIADGGPKRNTCRIWECLLTVIAKSMKTSRPQAA